MLKPVTATLWGMEYSIHECPKTHRDDVASIFPQEDMQGMLIVPTCQKSDVNLVGWGEQADVEKDRLLERFVQFASCVCEWLMDKGYWADYIDPCSGLPMIHKNGNNVYGEVQGLVTLLGYQTQNAGCCKIILHPKWGSSVYPASFFTKAPLHELENAIRHAETVLAP
ncbi:hypothetical protein M9434_001471 [Picochlorum sp. BPE23]|nr:hypothetical protein M9434_001471 [Picochlorum sp. BPE23]